MIVLSDRIIEREQAVLKGTEDALEQAAHEGLVMMRRRTKRGISRRGRRFAPYRPSTAKKKGSQLVNLTDRGDMLSYLEVTQKGRYVQQIGLGDPFQALKGAMHQRGTKRMTQREWFGLTVREAREMHNDMGTYIRQSTPPESRKVMTLPFSL